MSDGAAQKSAFTPGPWKAVECGFPGAPESEFPPGIAGMQAYMTENLSKGGERMFIVCAADQDPRQEHIIVGTTGNGPTSEANADLFAAAPDLFAALEAIVYYHDEGMHEVAQGHLMNARAAIAKARRLVADACEGCQRTDVGTRLSADDVRLCEACFAECAAATKARGEVQP